MSNSLLVFSCEYTDGGSNSLSCNDRGTFSDTRVKTRVNGGTGVESSIVGLKVERYIKMTDVYIMTYCTTN